MQIWKSALFAVDRVARINGVGCVSFVVGFVQAVHVLGTHREENYVQFCARPAVKA